MENENEVKAAELNALEQQKMEEEQAFLEDWTKFADELIQMGNYLEEFHILRRAVRDSGSRERCVRVWRFAVRGERQTGV